MTKSEAQKLLAQPDISAGMSPEGIANLKKGLDPFGNPLTEDTFHMSSAQAAVAAGLALGAGIVVLFGAPLWGGILVGSATAFAVNKAIDKAA